jgi:hypothetical protein
MHGVHVSTNFAWTRVRDPAGSTRGGSGGNERTEALFETAPLRGSTDSTGRNVSEHWAGLEILLCKSTRHNNEEDR